MNRRELPSRLPRGQRGGCPSGKIRHREIGDALDAALSSSLAYGIPFRAYDCPKCDGFHVTRLRKENYGQSVAAEGNGEATSGTLA